MFEAHSSSLKNVSLSICLSLFSTACFFFRCCFFVHFFKSTAEAIKASISNHAIFVISILFHHCAFFLFISQLLPLRFFLSSLIFGLIVGWSVDPPLWPRLKYPSNCWVDFHDILYKHSLSVHDRNRT